MSQRAAAPPSPRRARARRGDGERLREEIIAAATALLIEHGGEAGVSIRAIADAVGVTPPSIYLHFADKDELIVAVSDDRFQELDRLMGTVAATATDPLDEVRKRGEAYIRFGLDNPEQYRILFMAHARSASPEKVQEWAALQHMVEAVQRCIDAGQVVGDDAFLITLALWSAVHGVTSLMVSMPTFPWPPADAVIGQVLDTCSLGIVPR
ncbi:MAG: TetR/AcrR family transcriptional regulator [Acidimicrobiales bacterium]